ncbi:universal stress protein A-like protein [Prosopis cineraria]|uniref:universal stress protein A-like protein n=1 Tax=Prosopis cineraria TaxID=364024 RepID=UPI00240FFB6C|nr:universal stress protein A-like protein [Prosopis cineraria]XP_054810113.1 universal stress protein A-like protein [Prosopis cineraria]
MEEDHGGTGKKVMVAIDESDDSYYALIWLLKTLKESLRSKPVLLFMVQPAIDSNYIFSASLGSARLYSLLSPRPDFVNSFKENQEKLALALLERAKSICASHGVDAEICREEGDPRTALCDAVVKHNIDLLVLGERELGTIKRALIGSVGNYCVQNAKCPVLVVKKPE